MAYSSKSYTANKTLFTPSAVQFRVGVCGCSHVKPDNTSGRKSFGDYLKEVTSETMGFDPEIILHLGDFFSSQDPTELASDTAEGVEAASQRNSCAAMPVHRIYDVEGNHCAGAGNYAVYNRYIDTFGTSTAYSGVNSSLRPYPITGTVNKHYSFQTGNVLWLMLSDRNDGSAPCGRSDATGGHPSGSVLLETYDWWATQVLANQDKIIITCHHNNLKDTTIATGDNEGVDGGYHGTSGQAIASGRLENIITTISPNVYTDAQTAFQSFLAANLGLVSVWACAHTHYSLNRQTQETYNGRGWYKHQWGTYHISCGGLTRHHGTSKTPNSKFFQFTVGSNVLRIYNVNHGGYFSTGIDNYNYIDVPLSHAFEL